MAADPYRYFRVEARELVEQLGQGVLDLEKRQPSADLISRLLRFAHTLKGAARVVKQPQIADHAHQLEDLFAAIRDSPDHVPRDQIDRALALLDQVSGRVAGLSVDRPPDQTAGGPPADRQDQFQAFRPDAADMEALVDGIAEAQTQVAVLRPRLEQTDRIRHLIEVAGDHLDRIGTRDGLTSTDAAAIGKARSMIEEVRGQFGALERAVAYGIDQLDRELRQVSDAAARLRLVPASAVFRFLERAARDAAHALGKRVLFESRGGDVRVDSGVLAIVQGAMLQTVRNAVAHGIESPDERLASGKSPAGVVTIDVLHRSGSLSFVCSDDGRGVDVDAVSRLLERKGLRGAARDGSSSEELLRLLLKSGISTAETVTEVAGRGIGLDVVREAAERLGGEVSMRTDRGKGTTVRLDVPSSIAAFPALLVEVSGVTAAVPLEAVRRARRVTPDEVLQSAQGSSILQDGMALPLWRLPHLPASDAGKGPNGAYSAVVMEVDQRIAALAVDRVIGTASIVMRPLPEMAPALPSVVGASIDASGQLRLVLDPAILISEAAKLGPLRRDADAVRRPILVVDDSLTTRMLEQSILESAGYEVSVASSAEEGLEKARAGAFALFLVDVEMPGMDGFAFIEHVRADPVLRGIPSILVTSRASAEDQQRGREVGAAGYVVKGDFDQRALLERIRTLVE